MTLLFCVYHAKKNIYLPIKKRLAMMLHLGTKEIYFGQKKPKEMAYKELSWSIEQSWKKKFPKDMW